MTKQQPTSKNSNLGWAASLLRYPACTLSALLLLALPAQRAHAQDNHQQLVYEVYAGGIHAVQTTLNIKIDKNGRYDFVMDAHTRGFLASLIPWKGTFESHGWALKDKTKNATQFRPEIHKSTTSWRKKIDIKEYIYNKDGTFKSLKITDEYHVGKAREVEKELTDQTTDVLSATLQVLSDYNKTGECKGQAEVFDGKRRFKQEFQHQQETELTSSKYNLFSGKAAQCSVEVTPIAGAWHKKPRGWLSIQEQGRDQGTMPTVWIGKINEDGPAIPIKVRIKTAYGTLFMHLAEYNNGDHTMVAEKRIK